MIHDISVPLHNGMPVWPDSNGIKIIRTSKIECGDQCNVSRLDCDIHVGTHIDAPYHFLDTGATIDELKLENLVGPAVVVHFPDLNVIVADDLERLDIPDGISRILFRTRNSDFWKRGINEFEHDYVALTSGAASWLVDKGFFLVGIDYLSIQRYGDSPLTHKILLENNVIILEGLDLSGIKPRTYQLICLPLNLKGVEGAPARAVLIDI